MKRLFLLLLTGILTTTVLAACDNDDQETNENDNIEEVEVGVDEDENVERESEEVDHSENIGQNFKVTEDPQTDLRMGDTGLVQTSIGTYELMIDSAEIVGTELDGEQALLDEIILLEMTFKNLSDVPINAEDIMLNLRLTTDLEGADNTNAAASFESIEYFEGEIAPGQERKAQFITDTRSADEYYFRTATGTIAAGTQNEVIWTIMDDEARSE